MPANNKLYYLLLFAIFLVLAPPCNSQDVDSFNVGYLTEHGYLAPWVAYEKGTWNLIFVPTFLELEEWKPFSGLSMTNMPPDWYGGMKFKDIWYYPTNDGALKRVNVLNPALVDIVDFYFVVLQTDYMEKQPDNDRVYKVRKRPTKKVGLVFDNNNIVMSSAVDVTKSDDFNSGKVKDIMSLAENEFAFMERETIGKINDGVLLKQKLDWWRISVPIDIPDTPFELRSLFSNNIPLYGNDFYYYEVQKRYAENRLVAYFQAWIKRDSEGNLIILDKQANMFNSDEPYKQGFSPTIPIGFAIVNGTINIFIEKIGYESVKATILKEKVSDSGTMLIDVLKR